MNSSKKREFNHYIKPSKTRTREKVKLAIGFRPAMREVLRESADLLARVDISHLRATPPHESFLPITDAVLIEYEHQNYERARAIVVKRLRKMLARYKNGGGDGNAE